MSITTSTTSTPLPASTVRLTRSRVALYAELTKARLSALVVLSTAAAFVVAVPGPVDWLGLLWTTLGTALAAACANGLNQVWEARRDARMVRTASRPLPAGAMSSAHAFGVCIVLGYVGLLVLGLFVNLLAAGLALFTILFYVLAYTPLKSRSTLNTLVGAVCGAVPPLIGWAGRSGGLDTGAWLLAALLFVWQLPHFLALAWKYRDDYARGGYRMLPNVDPTGLVTAQASLFGSVLLVLIALIAPLTGLGGWWFAAVATMLAAGMVLRSVSFVRRRTDEAARSLFLASLLYLTLVLAMLVIDPGPIASLQPVVEFAAQQSAGLARP